MYNRVLSINLHRQGNINLRIYESNYDPNDTLIEFTSQICILYRIKLKGIYISKDDREELMFIE